MGQEEVLRIIEKSATPISAREIINILKCNPKTVFDDLKGLLKHKEIAYMELNRVNVKDYCERAGIKRVKQRMRLYFIETT